jgi:hypothetical protein
MSKAISEEKLKAFLEDIKENPNKFNSRERIQAIRHAIETNKATWEAMTSIDMESLMKMIS